MKIRALSAGLAPFLACPISDHYNNGKKNPAGGLEVKRKNRPVAAFLLCVTFLPVPALCAGYGSEPSPTSSRPSTTENAQSSVPAHSFPWTRAHALLATLQHEVSAGGIMAVAPHAAELEQILIKPQLTYGVVSDGKLTIYVLTDGPAEAMVALAVLGHQKGARAVALTNPYPLLSLYLASYYDEIKRPDQALHVLDTGLKLSPISGVRLGETVPNLIAERGAALAGLKHWQDEVNNENAGLKLGSMSDNLRALLYRGRGFALTELGRLDEAEAAYKESLKLEPGNPRAEHELQYIAGLRAGSKPVAGGIISLQPSAAAAQKN